ncbi:MAG: lytic murein transglycosylase [Hyphomicrobiaceae bacterium]
MIALRVSGFLFAITLLMTSVLPVPSASAVADRRNCKNTGSFNAWMRDFKAEAVRDGIPKSVVERSLRGVTVNRGIIRYDRKQNIFSLSFLQFVKKLVSANRLRRGPRMIAKYKRIFDRVERKYGVPAPVITAFWGLESDFGSFMGKKSSIRSLATLAYDCRRPEIFRPQLKAALRIVERGDLRPRDMIGSWAGELGQTQFLPTHYLTHAVDFDGDGRRDLLKSVPDMIASTGAYLKHFGWKRGQPWVQEVRLTKAVDWKEADLAIRHSRKQWAAWGIRRANGKPIKADGLKAALLLPMGRDGPAFLTYHNFDIYTQWNESLVYALTAAYYATRLDGAARLRRASPKLKTYDYKQIRQIQSLLARRGYDVGGVDGKMGAKTRAAIKAMQIKFGLPADSYPSTAFIRRLRSG